MEHDAQGYGVQDQMVNKQEVEAMVGVGDSEAEEASSHWLQSSQSLITFGQSSTQNLPKYRREIQAIRKAFEDEVDMYDTTMVSEYSNEIYEYMSQLEVNSLLVVWTGR